MAHLYDILRNLITLPKKGNDRLSVVLFRTRQSPLTRYVIGIIAALAAFALKLLLSPYLKLEDNPFLFSIGAVMVSAVFGGFGSGLITTGLTCLFLSYIYLFPVYNSQIVTTAHVLRVSLYIIEALGICWIAEMMRSALLQSEFKTEQLEQSEQRLRLMITGVKDYATYMLSPEGYVKTWNEGAQRIKGYTDEEIIGKHYSIFFTVEDIKNRMPWKALQRAVTQGRAQDEGWRLRKNGEMFWARVTIVPVYDEKGKLIGFTKLTRDLSKYRESNEALRKSEAKFRKLFDSNIIGIFIGNMGGVIQDANDAYLRLIGYSKEDLLSKLISWDDITPKEYTERDQQAIKEVEKNGVCTIYEKEYIRKDGKKVPVIVGYASLDDNDDRCIGFVLDISERKMLEQRKDEFISIASHELKTPLTSIKAFTQILLLHVQRNNDDKSVQYLTKMETQINRLTNLVSDLLDVSRIQSGKLELHEEAFVFDEILEDVIESLQLTTQTHKIICEGKTGQRVFADKNRIEQVLTNLITNAVKYSPGQDAIYVKVSHDTKNITVCVQDTGIGIPQDKQDKLFQRFSRVESNHGERFQGLGLGLYISAQIIQRHNGRIWVESPTHHEKTAEGEKHYGSTFCFSLPISLENRLLATIKKVI